MNRLLRFITLFFCFLLIRSQNVAAEVIKWQPWSDDAFEVATKNQRLVILDLEAVWCHWCHVMEEKTYSNPEIQNIINSKFNALRVDQDARPDLANRYRDYGWPATVIFNSNGKELFKRAGFVEPEEMLRILNFAVNNPDKAEEVSEEVEKFSESALLTADTRKALIENHYSSYDYERGSFDINQKFLDGEQVELALTLFDERHDQKDEKMIRLALDNNLRIFDSAWGGVYQYSTRGDWVSPHFEKIVTTQEKNMRIYAFASSLLKEPRYLAGAKEVYRYLDSFLTSPEGAFYTSQDADVKKGKHSAEYFQLNDTERRKIGIPAVDKHNYSRENGLLIGATISLYRATGDSLYLNRAKQAATWILKNRSLPEGGFRHDEIDKAGPYFSDSLFMAEGMLAIYSVTGEREWLAKTEQTANFIIKNFKDSTNKVPGYYTFAPSAKTALPPSVILAENIIAARFFNLLFHYTGNASYKTASELAFRYIVTPSVALKSISEPGVLLADREIANAPLHLTVVGSKSDAAADSLFKAAVQYPKGYKRVEWLDRKEGPLPNPDVKYPELPKAAVFICTNKRCSLPLFTKESMDAMIVKLLKK